jgi:hypothetical protein
MSFEPDRQAGRVNSVTSFIGCALPGTQLPHAEGAIESWWSA